MISQRVHFAISLVLLLTACQGATSIEKPPQISAAADQNEIRKLVLNDSLSHIDAEDPHPIFVSIEGNADPSPELLHQLQLSNGKVKPISACRLDGAVIDKETNEQGLGLFLRAMTLSTSTSARAETWLFYSKRAGYGLLYELEFRAGQWCIVQCKRGAVA